jgi:hypothetical protein
LEVSYSVKITIVKTGLTQQSNRQTNCELIFGLSFFIGTAIIPALTKHVINRSVRNIDVKKCGVNSVFNSLAALEEHNRKNH